jgi:hypothetical protein
MKDFRNGVRYYTKATAEIGFPEDRVCCDYCPMLETYARKQCRRTGEYLMDTRVTVGYYCPLEFNGEVDTKNEQSG